MRVINWFDMLQMNIEKHPMWEYLIFMRYVGIFKIMNNVLASHNQ